MMSFTPDKSSRLSLFLWTANMKSRFLWNKSSVTQRHEPRHTQLPQNALMIMMNDGDEREAGATRDVKVQIKRWKVRIFKVIRMHPLRTANIWTKSCANPSIWENWNLAPADVYYWSHLGTTDDFKKSIHGIHPELIIPLNIWDISLWTKVTDKPINSANPRATQTPKRHAIRSNRISRKKDKTTNMVS